MSKFQLFLLLFFGVAIVGAVLVFSFVHTGSGTTSARITIWGDISSYDFNTFLSESGLSSDSTLTLTYTEKSADTFDTDFTEALAEGTGPDLVILSQDKVWKQRNKLSIIPYTTVSQKDFINTFADEGTLFLNSAGSYALPLTIDPLVMFYNRDLLSSASLALPPAYWDQMYDYAAKLTARDNAGNITKSAIALGTSSNIPHAKEILSLLMLQAGTPITDIQGSSINSELLNAYNLPNSPADSALDFYTQFSDPAKPFYSWNRSQLPALTSFISGDSALYLGFASELRELKAKSPTLALGIMAVPQSRVAGKSFTFGQMKAVAIVKSSPNQAAAYSAALKLSSSDTSSKLATLLGIAPARRTLLANKPGDLYLSTFYDAAIQAKGWLDPDTVKTRKIFTDMIDSVTSGRSDRSNALRTAEDKLNTLGK
ncbi:MAG: hypothetical protein JWL80_312 [Parcubacteria group bacterium]|nr:hypothetical protein [Parcubacteria group bacterium]